MKKIKYKNSIIILFIFILNIISILNMYNAKLISPSYNNAFVKQSLWLIIGYLLIFFLSKFKIRKLFNYAKYLYWFSILLLVLVLIIGSSINGSKCWLNLFGISFQPSELVHITLILEMIRIINKKINKTTRNDFLLIIELFITMLIPSFLVYLEPDTGAIISYLLIFVTIIINLKLDKKWYVIIFASFTILMIIFASLFFWNRDLLIKIIGSSLYYRIDRILFFANGKSYQLENALTTIGASSFFGVGINKILLYIPEAPTDFIFSFSIGNYGYFSAIVILFSYFIIDILLIHISNKQKQNDYKLFISSFISIFIFNQLYNISMNIGLLPIMGIPLPFLSYGGTNTIINFIFVGIVLNSLKDN